MKISEIITDKYKLRISPTVYYELLADVVEAEEEQEPKTGRWIKKKKHHKDDFQEFDYWDVRCSECGARKRIGWTNIRNCPMCGVKMEPYTKRGASK